MDVELIDSKSENGKTLFLKSNQEIQFQQNGKASQSSSDSADSEEAEAPFSNQRVVNLTDVILKDNAASFGSDVMSGETLQIGSNVTMLDGLYLKSRSVIPAITRHLSTDAVIQLETSPYLTPNATGAPIAVASSSIPLLPQDAAAFRVPPVGFAGWSPRLSGDGTQVVLAPEVYLIAYENTRGEENPNPSSFTAVTPTIALSDLQNTAAYRFLGWFDAPEGGNRVSEIPQGSIGDRTFYARWDTIVYTITYYGNDEEGSKAESLPPPQSVLGGESVILSDESPTRTGFLFLSWNTSYDGTGTTYRPEDVVTNVRADIGLYAQWSKLRTVIYYGNDSGGSPAQGIPEPFPVFEGQSFSLSYKIPTRSGYLFTSWNTSSKGGGIRYLPAQTVGAITSDLDLYAQWLSLPPKYFRVCFIPNIRCSCEVCGMPAPMTVREHHSVRIPSCQPCRPFCRFIGWNTRADGCGSRYMPGQSIVITKNLTLFAQWR